MLILYSDQIFIGTRNEVIALLLHSPTPVFALEYRHYLAPISLQSLILFLFVYNSILGYRYSSPEYEVRSFPTITVMETTANKIESTMPTLLNPEPPVRILVQTLTHLVPGSGNFERTDFILNRICQHHWNCDFHSPKFRWASYNDQFAFNNRRCFFLVDYGESENDGNVPVLSYEWTGESLKPQPQLAKDPEIQTKLKTDVPFTRQPSEREKPPIRKLVKSRLYCEEDIPISEVDYMREHSEDVEWLKANVRPRFWRKFLTQVNNNKPPGAPDIEE